MQEAAEQAKAAKAEEEAKQKRAQIEQRRQARAAENAQRREQFSSIDQVRAILLLVEDAKGSLRAHRLGLVACLEMPACAGCV